MDIGTISRTDSGETGGLTLRDDDTDSTLRDLPAEKVSLQDSTPHTGERFPIASGSPEKQNSVDATKNELDIRLDHEILPRENASKGTGNGILLASLPPPMSVPPVAVERERSHSAVDELRGEMDFAFGDNALSNHGQEPAALFNPPSKLTCEESAMKPDNEDRIAVLAPSSSITPPLQDHSDSIYQQPVPDIHTNMTPIDDRPDSVASPQAGLIAPVMNIATGYPPYSDSDLYSATTRSASPPPADPDAEDVRGDNHIMSSNMIPAAIEPDKADVGSRKDTTEPKDTNSKRSSAVSNYLAMTTVHEVLSQVSKPETTDQKDDVPNRAVRSVQVAAETSPPAGLGLMHDAISTTSSSEIIPEKLATSLLNLPKYEPPPIPRRRPPIPQPPQIVTPVISSTSSPPPHTPTSAVTGSDLSSLASPSERDSSTFNTVSTISSSEFPEVNTAASIQYSNTPTTATTLDIAATASVREQGQIKLRNLHSELAAAKARGDSKSQEEAIQKSIEVIWRSYLAPPAEPPTESPSTVVKSPSIKLKNRASILRLPSLTSSSKATSLGNAAANGDATIVVNLLEEKINVNSTSFDFKTPLMRAAINGHITCLQVLRTYGADEFAVDKTGSTVLHHAVASNNRAAVKWLLDSYLPPSPELIRHRSSILLRATEVTKWGRAQKNLREASDAGGSKPLHIAVAKDMGGMVKMLLAADVDIEAKNNHGQTPLHQAIIAGREDSFDTLLRNGSKIDALDGSLLSPLHWAAKCGNLAMTKRLLDMGASRWNYDLSGKLPIHQAAWEGRLPTLEALLTERSDLDRVTKYGETLLHISALRNHQVVAEYLIKNTVDVNPWSVRDHGRSNEIYTKLMGSSLTPLHYACCMGHFEMAVLLLDHEAFVNAPTPDGYTPLMMAVESGNTDIVSLLHRRGAKVNASLPGTMMTALHMASKRGDLETVRELCRAGANWKALAGKDSYKRMPTQEADSCPDKAKRLAVKEYFATIRTNELNKARYNAAIGPNFGSQQQTIQSSPRPVQQSVSYAPWVTQTNNPTQTYALQHTQSAPQAFQGQWASARTYMDELMRPPTGHTQYFDPTSYETQVDSPPPYQPGNTVSARLAAQPPVHRPNY